MGWCSMIGLKCKSLTCSANVDYIATSPKQDQRADVNTMAVLAMRNIGKIRAAANKILVLGPSSP